MRLEKTIHLDARQPEHLTQFLLGDATGPKLFNGEGFQRSSGEIASVLGQVGSDFVRDVQGHFHEFTLARTIHARQASSCNTPYAAKRMTSSSDDGSTPPRT